MPEITETDVKITKKSRGRPSILTEELLQKAREYVEKVRQDEEKVPEVIPSITGLAFHLKVNRSDIYYFAMKNEEFYNIVETILQAQERRVLNLALMNKINPRIAFLVLARHGYTLKQEINSNVKIQQMTEFEKLIDDVLSR